MSSDQPKKKVALTNALVNLGAINKATGKYETPIFATKKNEYVCPDCGQDVILKQGEVRKYHFAHYSSLSSKNQGECSYYSHPGESQIHKHAKELLKVALEKKRCIVRKSCDMCHVDTYVKISKVKETDEVLVECAFALEGSRKVADVAILDHEGYIKVIFEIYHTHKTREGDRPEPWYELKALEVIRDIENSNEIFDVRCVRQKVCWMCLKFKELDEKKPEWFLVEGREPELEWYIRYKLGQRDFFEQTSYSQTQYYYGSKTTYLHHLRFKFDEYDGDEPGGNESFHAYILHQFKKFYGRRRVSVWNVDEDEEDLVDGKYQIVGTRNTVGIDIEWSDVGYNYYEWGFQLLEECSSRKTVWVLANIILSFRGHKLKSKIMDFEERAVYSHYRFWRRKYVGKICISDEGLILDNQDLVLKDLELLHLFKQFHTAKGIKINRYVGVPKDSSLKFFNSGSDCKLSDVMIYPSQNPLCVVGLLHRPFMNPIRFSLSVEEFEISSKTDLKRKFLSWICTISS